jgi:hypothetical protein
MLGMEKEFAEVIFDSAIGSTGVNLQEALIPCKNKKSFWLEYFIHCI